MTWAFFDPLNPTFSRGGGHYDPPPSRLGSGASYIDPRDSKFWYNSYFILTMDIPNVLNPKGVPKKIWSMIFEAGVKNQNFKFEAIVFKFCRGFGGPKTNFFCFQDPIVIGPYFRDMAVSNFKMGISRKWGRIRKNVTA